MMLTVTKEDLLQILLSVYTSFFISMWAALICSASIWLEMRVNLGYVFFGICFFLFFTVWHKPLNFLKRATILSFLLAIGSGGILHGAKSLFVIPAAFIREGLGKGSLSFSSINTGMFIFFGLGLLGYVYLCIAIKRKSK